METDEIDITGTKLSINKDCPVAVTDVNGTKCKPATSGQRRGGDNAVAIAAPLVVILVAIAVGILVLVGRFLFWKKRTGESYNIFRCVYSVHMHSQDTYKIVWHFYVKLPDFFIDLNLSSVFG